MLERRGEGDAAEGLLRAAIDWARSQQARSWELRAATTLAELLERRRERPAAREVLEPIYRWFEKEGLEGGHTRSGEGPKPPRIAGLIEPRSLSSHFGMSTTRRLDAAVPTAGH